MAEVEFLLLGDHAEAVGGKLHIIGAGWTDHWRGQRKEGDQIPLSHFGVGVGVLVPWTETNQPHPLVVRIENEDGTQVGQQVQANVEMGRPAGLPSGAAQRAVLAINVNIQFPAPGGYRIVTTLGGRPGRTVSFRVHDRASPR